ncbi:MAG: TetR/AcrR family transcriptional regulator [Anaerolineae bacterium]
MATTRRERVREATIQEIKQTAARQIATDGAAALSLRGIAIAMGMTPPALYRYFDSRDALVTALIVDAYGSFADALEAASAAAPPEEPIERLRALGRAYRAWALAHPQDYALVFGTPLPGYHAPSEVTMPIARRAMIVLVDGIQAVLGTGQSIGVASEGAPVETSSAEWRAGGATVAPSPALRLALAAWTSLHGFVSLELFNHLQPLVGDPTALFEAELDALLERIRHENDTR